MNFKSDGQKPTFKKAKVLNTASIEQTLANARKRQEQDILRNTAIKLPLGNTEVELKALPWLECDDFDNVLRDAFLKVGNLFPSNQTNTAPQIDEEGNIVNAPSFDLEKIMDVIFEIKSDDMLTLAQIATRGTVTKDLVIESEATRNDVIEIVVEAFKLNYSGVKKIFTASKLFR
jgi:hypothetical protein